MPIRFSCFNKMAVALLVLSCATVCAQTKSVTDNRPVDIVVQGAMDSELQPLLDALDGKEEIQIAAWTFWRGKIGSKTVVVSRTEVGTINAVVSTTLAITTFKPKLVINQGTAGAHDPELKVFDIVVGEASVDFGAFRSAHADAGAGIDQSRWTPMPHRLRMDGKERVAFNNFPGDEEAMKTAMGTAYKQGRVVKGIIGSSFEFNKEIDRLNWVRKTFGASSEDMESVFAAGTAAGFNTRFLAIRIISNSEFHSPKFEEVAGKYCAAFVVDVIKRLK
ncbi:MAG: 5'-methylthioadenosine/S-adenosylhomocysteine nucleosidase [Acidobacteriota bacterium]|nr:5'-methylthioadenosine/S-adenosylhomocysteine nucleosidase [Acidobacteriota bacterium]